MMSIGPFDLSYNILKRFVSVHINWKEVELICLFIQI